MMLRLPRRFALVVFGAAVVVVFAATADVQGGVARTGKR